MMFRFTNWLRWQKYEFDLEVIDNKRRHPHIALIMFTVMFCTLALSCFAVQEIEWHNTSTKEPTCYVENFGSYNNRDGSANAELVHHKNKIVDKSFKTNSNHTATAK